MHSVSPVLRLSVAAALALACARTPPPSPAAPPGAISTSVAAPLSPAQQKWVDETLARLTLRERVGQMLHAWVLGDYASTDDPSFVETRRLITESKIGGITMSLGSPIEVAAKINALQRIAEIPLLVASDLEPGLGRLVGGVHVPSLLPGGSATLLTTNMAIGAAGRESDAYELGRIAGREARAIGITVAFSPTVDVNNNPANPVINTRSFGEDPAAVGRLAAAFVRGVQEQGVVATVKHFPGHGDTDTDSHLALPVVKSSRARLDSVELVPFRAAIEANVAAVMTAHIALPAIGDSSAPATLIPEVITELLRDSLNFRGLIITDALTMEGVGKGYSVEKSAVLAVKAGADILLNPRDIPKAIAAVVASVESGEVSRERIDRSVRALLAMKARLGLPGARFTDLDKLREVVGAPSHWAIARDVAQRAITLLRDSAALLPIPRAAKVAVVTYAPELEILAGRAFVAELRPMLSAASVHRIGPGSSRAELDSLAAAVGSSDRVIVTTHVRTIEGEGRFAIPQHVTAWIDSLAAGGNVIVVANGNPYVIRHFPNVKSYVLTYGIDPLLERAAARALTGDAAISGHAPISLPGYFSRGDGIMRRSLLAQRQLEQTLTDTVRALLGRAVTDSAFPGAYAVVGSTTTIYASQGAGQLDWAASPAPNENTIWDLASLTKVVGMTTAIMQLTARGLVDLDAPVQRYLPMFAGDGKERVRVRDLLTHSSGLPSWRPLYKEASSPENALAIILATPLDTVPGARMVYSDLGAILLGRIVEVVTKEKLDRYLGENVFGPLGMTSTFYKPDSASRSRVAPTEFDPWRQRHLRGEVHDENAFTLGGVSGHAGLFSSAHDMVRFARMLLKQGVGDGGLGVGTSGPAAANSVKSLRIVPARTIRDFTRVQDSSLSHRALGWETARGASSAGRLMSRAAFGHTGFTGTSLWVDPSRDLFVILLTNRVNPTRENRRIGAVRSTLADAVVAAMDAAPLSVVTTQSETSP
ncbi:MAG: serine hydrolase [Gemmatimonadaceae bacterium]|nr:serine hydrolase [Gemmatimonadaceae bacterium]